jgi:hypothetical protein
MKWKSLPINCCRRRAAVPGIPPRGHRCWRSKRPHSTPLRCTRYVWVWCVCTVWVCVLCVCTVWVCVLCVCVQCVTVFCVWLCTVCDCVLRVTVYCVLLYICSLLMWSLDYTNDAKGHALALQYAAVGKCALWVHSVSVCLFCWFLTLTMYLCM